MTEQISVVFRTLQKIWDGSWAFLLALSIAFGLILFMPESFAASLGLVEITKNYRAFFGVAFILVTVLLLCKAIPFFHKIYKKHQTRKRWIKRLHDLSPMEKRILRKYLSEKTRTVHLDITNGVAAGLEAEHIIARFSSVGYPAGVQKILFAYNIQSWAWDYIRKNPEILEE